ncbi:DASS family sodium-coupled anion symporter [Clostridium sp. YIM B02555]|uniref:DASS family sodium-coupled anion symporter n=1 Tax=Clostridium sp. YIM B02555 TaxID=2911968 RepID=UPI001EEE1CB6|nr:DASS family sodium-coupled anion symporter [Clostridium sp. YIM B02555]
MDKKTLLKLCPVILIPLALWVMPVPEGLKPETWHVVALYIALLLGLVIKPFSEPVITLIIIGIMSMFIDPKITYAGYGTDMAWFILAVCIVCTAFVKTGLGKRIAYNLLTRFGKTSLGLGYMLMIVDLILSPATGSNTSRTSIDYPIFRNIAEGVGSTPEKEPRKLGAYLTMLMYVISMSTAVLFLTGMATNAITASLAQKMLNVNLDWMTWFKAAVVPAGLVLILSPIVVYKVYKPELKELGDIKPMMKKGLEEMGPMKKEEKILSVLFALAIIGWMFGPKIQFVSLTMQIVAFVFLALTLLFGILNWNDVIGEKGAWNTFVWYGSFYGVASALASQGFYTWLAKVLEGYLKLSQLNGIVATIILLLISLAVRYFFVSNSAFVASFYPVLFALALTTQAPIMVVALLLAFFSGYGALLTHYGNGAGIYTFATGYCTQKDFWRVGTIMVGVALVIFLCIGLPYWKVIGLW